jgi:hypothetical protein
VFASSVRPCEVYPVIGKVRKSIQAGMAREWMG